MKYLVLFAAFTFLSGPAFSGTAFTADQATNDRALELLIRNAAKLKPSGDTSKGETMASILRRFVIRPDADAKVANTCAVVMNATLLECSLTYDASQAEENVTYQFDIKYDVKTEKVSIIGFAKLDVEVSRGGP